MYASRGTGSVGPAQGGGAGAGGKVARGPAALRAEGHGGLGGQGAA